MPYDPNADANDLRSLMNRKMNIESQMNDLQSDISKLKRQKDEAELELRKKRKEIERMKVELIEIENKDKRRAQEQYEMEAQYSALKKQLDKIVVDIKNAQSR